MEMPEQNVAKSVGIILDGNRRWAKEKGLPTLEGHRRGYNKLRDLCEWGKERGVKDIVVYAFSLENWQRLAEEVNYLMDLFRLLLGKDLQDFHKRGARVRFIGDLSRLPKDIQADIVKAEKLTEKNEKINLWACVSYGGREEIMHAAKRMIEEKIDSSKIDEKTFSKFLYTADMIDPDIIIRTGGEMRLSGFLPWQSVYSEFFFPKTFWPEFSKEDFFAILDEFATRKRRHGK